MRGSADVEARDDDEGDEEGGEQGRDEDVAAFAADEGGRETEGDA
jgi:hypothetical protein